MGRDLATAANKGAMVSFNPRARMGRDMDATKIIKEYLSVSIHAPAWGATQEIASIEAEIAVSIHAPAWGATAFCQD